MIPGALTTMYGSVLYIISFNVSILYGVRSQITTFSSGLVEVHTYDSKVKRGLFGAVFVLQLQGVAATVVLVTRCDRQLTAVLWILYSDAATCCLDLEQDKSKSK